MSGNLTVGRSYDDYIKISNFFHYLKNGGASQQTFPYDSESRRSNQFGATYRLGLKHGYAGMNPLVGGVTKSFNESDEGAEEKLLSAFSSVLAEVCYTDNEDPGRYSLPEYLVIASFNGDVRTQLIEFIRTHATNGYSGDNKRVLMDPLVDVLKAQGLYEEFKQQFVNMLTSNPHLDISIPSDFDTSQFDYEEDRGIVDGTPEVEKSTPGASGATPELRSIETTSAQPSPEQIKGLTKLADLINKRSFPDGVYEAYFDRNNTAQAHKLIGNIADLYGRPVSEFRSLSKVFPEGTILSLLDSSIDTVPTIDPANINYQDLLSHLVAKLYYRDVAETGPGRMMNYTTLQALLLYSSDNALSLALRDSIRSTTHINDSWEIQAKPIALKIINSFPIEQTIELLSFLG